MRKIKLEKWKSRTPDGKEMDEDLLIALNVLIGNKKPEEMPRGLDNFRLFGRLSKAFEKADSSRELVLEEADYKFLKDTVGKDIPASWGMNANIMKSFEAFLDAIQE